MVILIGIFCVVVYTDMRFYKIPNVCIFAGMVCGLIMTYMSYSLTGVLLSCAAAAVIFAALYPFYLIGGLGAGDVKLFMMAGCFLRYEKLFWYLLVTFAVGALISSVKMVLFRESRQRLFYLIKYIIKTAITKNIDDYKVDKKNKRCVIRLSVPAFISLILMCLGMY